MARVSRHRDGRAIMTGATSLWAALVAVLALWQIAQYRGLMAFLAEWQFNALGRYYPSLTFVIVVIVLASPALLLFLRVRKRHSQQRLATATLRSALVFRRAMYCIAIACFGIAVVTLLQVFTLPNGEGEPHRIDLAQPLVALPAEGRTVINGAILTNRTAAFNNTLLFARHDVRFAPIVAPGAVATDLQFFIELPPGTVARADLGISMTGIVKNEALPGEIVRLYRYAGYRVERPYYVLFTDPATMRWPYFETAAQFALLALLFLAIGLWQRRRLRHIEKLIAESDSA